MHTFGTPGRAANKQVFYLTIHQPNIKELPGGSSFVSFFMERTLIFATIYSSKEWLWDASRRKLSCALTASPSAGTG